VSRCKLIIGKTCIQFLTPESVVWGAVCMCLAIPKTYQGFLVVRFFLGAAEGAVSPAFITITSIWYKKSEHALRIGCVQERQNPKKI